MGLFDSRTARALMTICVFCAVLWFVWEVRRALVIILFSVFFAYLLEPLVLRIEKSRFGRNSRGLAILETYLICGGVLAILLTIFGPKIVEDTRKLIQSVPSLIDKVASGKIVWQLGQRHGWSYATQARLEKFISSHSQALENFTARVGATVAATLKNFVWFLLIPILAIFFLKDGRSFAEGVIETIHRRRERHFLREVAQDLDEMLASFIGAQLILAGIVGVVFTSILTLAHFPYGLSLGVAAGFLEFIPVIGPLMAAALILGVGFLTAYPHLLLLTLFLGTWRVLEDYVISPRIMGNRVELHPLAVIVAVLMGSEIAGIIGVFLSVPVAATLRILWVRWRRFRAVQANQATAPGPNSVTVQTSLEQPRRRA